LKKSKIIAVVVVLAALAALVFWGRDKIHFDFAAFRAQLAQANWGKIALAFACIYVCYLFRSVRWALLLRHHKKIGLFTLLGTQVIGFTGVALIGRVADPVRPYLVARKTGLPLFQQIAVYIVERMFDIGSMALIFSSVLLYGLKLSHEPLPHPELLLNVAKSGLIVTVALAAFTVGVRLAGGFVAALMEKAFGLISQGLGHSVGQKIRSFHAGLDTMRSFSDFALILLLSLVMWTLIAFSYLETTTAFVASPELAAMNLPRCMVLMAASMIASGVQLPIIGWFTQIGIVAAAFSTMFGVAAEPATACAAMLLCVSFLGIIPVGLIWAQFEHISFRKIAEESGQASEEASEEESAKETV
jgi:uncharacterized protein (TIRG00374 family)